MFNGKENNFEKVKYLLFVFAVVFAIFFNTNIKALIGFESPTILVAFLPIVVYFVFISFTQKTHYNKIAVCLLIMAVIVILFKLSIGQSVFEVGAFNKILLLIMPMLMYICFDNMTKRESDTLRFMIILFFIVLCVIAIGEKTLNRHFLPVEGDTEVWMEAGYFRSVSLLWHPLMGGFFVAVFMSFVAVADFKKKIFQFFLFFLGYISLLCFDARGATLVVTFVLLPYFILKFYRMAGKRQWTIILGVICMLMGMVYLILETSLGSGRLLNMELMDSSGQTRLKVFNFYKYYKHQDDFIWGHPDNYQHMVEVGLGVENGVISLIMNFGIIFMPVILLLLFLLQYKSLSAYSKFDKWLLLFIFFGIGAMNPALSGYTHWNLWVIAYYSFRPEVLPLQTKDTIPSYN